MVRDAQLLNEIKATSMKVRVSIYFGSNRVENTNVVSVARILVPGGR